MAVPGLQMEAPRHQCDLPAKKRKGIGATPSTGGLPLPVPRAPKKLRVTGPRAPAPAALPPSVFPSLDICKIDLAERFAVSQAVLGSGQYGTVRECTDVESGAKYACKTMAKSQDSAEWGREAEDMRAEVDMMRRLQGCENVVQLRGVFEDSSSVHLVLDLCEGGDLYDEIVRRESFSEADAAHLLSELVQAVAFCHARGVVHRDLKPENILLTRHIDPHTPLSQQAQQGPLTKLADFGLSAHVAPGEHACGVVGSPLYMAPDVFRGEYGPKVDVWSLGVVLYILLSGSAPFEGADDDETFERIQTVSPDMSSPVWRGVSLEAKSLVKRLLVKDPALRPPAHKILSHPWIVHHVAGERSMGRRQASALPMQAVSVV